MHQPPSRLLLIDDRADKLQALRRCLQLSGYDVTLADGGASGLALIDSSNAFDLVLCDLRMPDLSGLEVLAEVRERRPNVPVVIITAWGTTATAAAARRLGAADYVDGFLNPDDIVAVVERHAARPRHVPNTVRHAACEWIRLIIPVAMSSKDTANQLEWCALVAIAQSTLKSRCAIAGVRAGESLDFARALRIVRLHAGHRVANWHNVVNVLDPRTLSHFLRACRFEKAAVVPSLDAFVERQTFITDRELITATLQAFHAPD